MSSKGYLRVSYPLPSAYLSVFFSTSSISTSSIPSVSMSSMYACEAKKEAQVKGTCM
jgi:hypothetical protein